MRRALQLARRGQGRVEPNPMVGAVLVRRGQVVAEGYHRRYGGPHAEVDALQRCRRLGYKTTGCELYVTLEPCNHTGKTPPCTDAIVSAGLRRVHVAMTDPSQRVRGRGITILRRAGIGVEVGLCSDQATDLNAPYVKRVRFGHPWVIAKWAQTLDGRIATASGDSRWISNAASRRHAHLIRGRVDAVVVGIGTVLSDDPALTARGVPVRRVARRVIVDPQLKLPPESKLIRSLRRSAVNGPVTVAVRASLLAKPPPRVRRIESLGVELIGLPPRPGHPREMDLAQLMQHLAQIHQATNVLVEGGSKLLGALARQGLIDQALAFVAPKLLGDTASLAVMSTGQCDRVRDAMGLSLRGVRRFGEDVLLDYRV